MKANRKLAGALMCATVPFWTNACGSEIVNKQERISSASQAVSWTPTSYTPDCNDPDDLSYGVPCVDLSPQTQANLHAKGYPNYLGHAEPSLLFFSTAPNSGSNMQWKVTLPSTDPSPTQNGSSVANFELYSTMWIGLDLCDPNSKPYGACTGNSDANNPATAGAAFLELQFYPPGASSNINGTSCPAGQWCVNLHINTAQDNTPFWSTQCPEPTTQQYLTTTGTPTTAGGTVFTMSTGDALLVTVHDNGTALQTDVKDITSGATGTMVASSGNGFVHNTTNNANGKCNVTTSTTCTKNSDCPSSEFCACQTTGFNFRPMYNTALPGNVVPWATLGPNVSFDAEIGHFELCGDSACGTLPDGADDGTCSKTFQICKTSANCPAGETCNPQTIKQCGTTRGIGGCGSPDLDEDGVCFQANWPDGTAAHPASVVIGSPNNTGVGPLSASGSSSTSYIQGYNTITFQTTTSTALATFYPFYSQAGTGASCVFNMGNDIPGVTKNDFGQSGQYGTTITNPCFPGPVARCKDVTVNANSSCQGTASTSDVNSGSSDPDGDTLTYTLSPTAPYGLGPNLVTLTASDSGGATSSCTATVTVVDNTAPTFNTGDPTTASVVSCQPGVVPETLTAPTATDICSCLSYSGTVTAVNGVAASIPLTQTGFTTFQALLPVGTLTVRWTATNCNGVASAPFTQTVTVTGAPALYARQTLSIAGLASIVTPTGTPAPIDNNGTVILGGTSLALAASAGPVLSVPGVTLTGATVDSVVTGGLLVNVLGTVRTGVVQQFTTPTLPPFPSVGVTSYPFNLNEVAVLPLQTVNLAPGSYDNVVVSPGGVLGLRAGTYLFNTLNIAPAATLKIDNTLGTVNVDVQTNIISLGQVQSSGQPNQFVLGFSGILPVQLLTNFKGVVVAPTAALTLAQPLFGAYSGAFYAQDISVAAGVKVTESPFGCQ